MQEDITPQFIRQVQARGTLLFSAEEIRVALDHLAQKMQQELEDSNPIFLTVMNGGLFLASELSLRLSFPLQMDYIHATRYQGEVTGAASIHWKKEPSLSLEKRVVVVIDDILDGGLTLQAITEYCHAHRAKRVYTVVLMDKINARLPEGLKKADFTGIVEENNAYVYGFGLDYHMYLRNLPGIYQVAPEDQF